MERIVCLVEITKHTGTYIYLLAFTNQLYVSLQGSIEFRICDAIRIDSTLKKYNSKRMKKDIFCECAWDHMTTRV